MMTFKEYIAQQNATQTGVSPNPTPPPTTNPLGSTTQGKWKASKQEILEFWKTLRTDTPIMLRPISYEHKGSTYGEDGLRITGSPQFISSVLARLKDFLVYETPNTKLAVSYRQTESPSKLAQGESKTSYVFYIAAKERGKKKPKTTQVF